jgi:hypothetical protein
MQMAAYQPGEGRIRILVELAKEPGTENITMWQKKNTFRVLLSMNKIRFKAGFVTDFG